MVETNRQTRPPHVVRYARPSNPRLRPSVPISAHPCNQWQKIPTIEFFGLADYVSEMEMEITLPDEVPVMTLSNVAFFPQALMPLHIFEPRYRQMLKDVLSTNRLFAVAGLNPAPTGERDRFEPPHRVASVGIVRACQKNENGTSNLLLQGLARVEVMEILADEPYRRIRIRALASSPARPCHENEDLRRELARLLSLKLRLRRHRRRRDDRVSQDRRRSRDLRGHRGLQPL